MITSIPSPVLPDDYRPFVTRSTVTRLTIQKKDIVEIIDDKIVILQTYAALSPKEAAQVVLALTEGLHLLKCLSYNHSRKELAELAGDELPW